MALWKRLETQTKQQRIYLKKKKKGVKKKYMIVLFSFFYLYDFYINFHNIFIFFFLYLLYTKKAVYALQPKFT